MKQSFYLTPNIDDECTYELIDFLNKSNENPETTEVDIYLHSLGGSNTCAQIIKDLLKNSPLSITLIAAGEISSAAWDIFYFTEGVLKKILPGTIAVLHMATHTIESRDLHKKDQWVLQQKIKLDLINKEMYDALKLYRVLSPKLLLQWSKATDVTLVYPEIVELMSRCPYGTFQ